MQAAVPYPGSSLTRLVAAVASAAGSIGYHSVPLIRPQARAHVLHLIHLCCKCGHDQSETGTDHKFVLFSVNELGFKR